MSLHSVKYNVKNRWIETDRLDEFNDNIMIVNPDPVVIVYLGVWTQRESINERHREHKKFELTASDFRAMTGIMVYGGDTEPRGAQRRTITRRIHRRIERHAQCLPEPTPKRRRTRKQPDIPDRIKDIQEGRIGQLKGVKCIRRRK